eukprot:symbB.v1.2.027632.t1/scaffold2846.1/size68995/4
MTLSICVLQPVGGSSLSNASRRLQVAHTFLMSELQCEHCCKEEWRACVCILGCDILQDQCHGVPAVETCNVLRECYTRVDNEYATRLTSASSMFVDWPDKMSFTHVVWSVPMVNGCRASCASCTFCFGSNLHESAEVLGLLVAS